MEAMFIFTKDRVKEIEKINTLKKKAQDKGYIISIQLTTPSLIEAGFEFPIVNIRGKLYNYQDALKRLD